VNPDVFKMLNKDLINILHMINTSKEIAFQAMMDFVIIGFLFLAIAQGS
jgi:hypothetical protein